MKKNTDISDRISQIVEKEGININTFSKMLGYSRSQALYDITNKRSKPSFDFFQRYTNSEFTEKYPVDWLISGVSKPSASSPVTNDIESLETAFEEIGLNGSKVYISTEPAMAGVFNDYLSEQREAEFFYMPALGSGVHAMFKVYGDSMHGTIEEGSWAICKLVEDDWELMDGKIYIVASNSNGAVIKRLMRRKWLKEKVVLYSDNYIHEPILMEKSDIKSMWAVKFILHKYETESKEAADHLHEFLKDLKLDYRE